MSKKPEMSYDRRLRVIEELRRAAEAKLAEQRAAANAQWARGNGSWPFPQPVVMPQPEDV